MINPKDFTKEILSLQEKKVSALILAFIFLCGLGAYLAITGENKDFPPNLVNVLLGLITAIAGVNAVEKWVNGNSKEGE